MERVSDYATKRALARRFARHRSAQLLIGGVGVAIVARAALGALGAVPFTVADVASALVGVSLVGVVEWFTHQVLFHAPEESRRARLLNTGHSHRRHHLDPLDMGWVLLDPRGARALMVAVAVLVTIWSVPIAPLVGTQPLGPYLTTLMIGWLAIAHYEWVHLLVHSRYRPKSRRYRRLARNHRLHHHRDERYWLGVTTNLGDRLFGTLPANRGVN